MRKVIFTLKEKLNEINKSAYWLAKETGITAKSLGKMINNETHSVKFENLEKICDVLGCELDEIIKLEDK